MKTMAAEGSSSAAQLPKRSLLAWIPATFVGIGFLRPGSGTWASAVTVAIWLVSIPDSSHEILVTSLAAVLITALGIPFSSVVARESGIVDPGFVVIDEVAGQLIALIAIPAQWQYALASFILFRGFDILKPPPLRKIEKLPGGWGIMLDDVGAGLYALALLHLWILFTHAH
jgi:phosphatidylglycerophosphatase A